MQQALFLHTPTGDRYFVLSINGIVYQAAGPLKNAQVAAVQRGVEIPWQPGLGALVERRRGEFEQVWPTVIS